MAAVDAVETRAGERLGENTIVVVDRGSSKLKVLDASTKALIRCIDLGNDISAIAVNVSGDHILVSDTRSHKIMVLDGVSGEVMRSIGAGEGEGRGELDGPFFMAVSAPPGSPPEDHTLLVSDYENCRICEFNLSSGDFVRSFIGVGYPMGISLWTPTTGTAPTDTLVYVTDCDNHHIAVFSLSSGSRIRSIGCGEGTDPGRLTFPHGLTIHCPLGGRDEDAVLLVVDNCNHRVQVFGVLSGELLRVLGGGQGSGVDQLCDPADVVVFNDSEVVVSDYSNHRLQVFDLHTGHHLRSVGAGQGSGDDQFESPMGLHLVVDDGEPYVLK